MTPESQEQETLTKPTRRAVEACGKWMAECVRIGWHKSQLDGLERMWWKYHDNRGNLMETGERSEADIDRIVKP